MVDLCGDIHFKYYYSQNILITKIKKTPIFFILEENVGGIRRVSNIKSLEQKMQEFTLKQINSMNVYTFMLVFFLLDY